jgi:hypothetical protein
MSSLVAISSYDFLCRTCDCAESSTLTLETAPSDACGVPFDPIFPPRRQRALEPLAALASATEFALGIVLLFAGPDPRYFAAVAIICLHLLILLAVGPLGANQFVQIWPWNVLCAILSAHLFIFDVSNDADALAAHPERSLWDQAALAAAAGRLEVLAALAVFGILPFFVHFGGGHPQLSFQMHSANFPTSSMWLAPLSDKQRHCIERRRTLRRRWARRHRGHAGKSLTDTAKKRSLDEDKELHALDAAALRPLPAAIAPWLDEPTGGVPDPGFGHGDVYLVGIGYEHHSSVACSARCAVRWALHLSILAGRPVVLTHRGRPRARDGVQRTRHVTVRPNQVGLGLEWWRDETEQDWEQLCAEHM